jgi:hypothetical protein
MPWSTWQGILAGFLSEFSNCCPWGLSNGFSVQLVDSPHAWLNTGMDEGTIKAPNPKCRLYWCLKEFIDWRYNQACWYFWPVLWISAPLPSLWPPPPLPHFPKVNLQHIQCVAVWGGGWGGVELCCRPYSAGFNTLFQARFRPTKLLPHLKQKHQKRRHLEIGVFIVSSSMHTGFLFCYPVLWIWIRMFLCLKDPDPSLFVWIRILSSSSKKK